MFNRCNARTNTKYFWGNYHRISYHITNPMKMDALIGVKDYQMDLMGILMQKTFEGKTIEYFSNSINISNFIKLLKMDKLI